MRNVSRSCLLFDLDGTLVDTAPDLTAALNHVLDISALEPVTVNFIGCYVGFGARVMIEKAMAHHKRSLTQAEMDAAHKAFLAYYEDNICVESQAYDGVVSVLENYRECDTRLAVCTNKPQALSLQLLEALDILKYFHVVCGSDSVSNRKPHPAHITETIERAEGHIANSVMIGDSSADIDAARAVGIPVIGMSYGYSPVPVADLKPDMVLHNFADLPDALRTLVKA